MLKNEVKITDVSHTFTTGEGTVKQGISADLQEEGTVTIRFKNGELHDVTEDWFHSSTERRWEIYGEISKKIDQLKAEYANNLATEKCYELEA